MCQLHYTYYCNPGGGGGGGGDALSSRMQPSILQCCAVVFSLLKASSLEFPCSLKQFQGSFLCLFK